MVGKKDIRDLEQHVDLADVTATLHHAVHHVHHPGGTLTTRRALTAGLVLVERREASDGRDDIGALVHDDNSTGTKTGLRILQGVVVHAEIRSARNLPKDTR